MNELNIQEQEQINTFSKQRDDLLGQLSILREEKNKLIEDKNKLADSSSDIEMKMNKNIGRLEELEKKEKEFKDKLSEDVVILLNQKTKLQSEITNYEKLIEVLKSKYETISQSIKDATEVYKTVFRQTGALSKVVDHVTRVNTENLNEANQMISNIKNIIHKK